MTVAKVVFFFVALYGVFFASGCASSDSFRTTERTSSIEVLGSSGPGELEAVLNPTQIAKIAKNSAVLIQSFHNGSMVSEGSGFFISSDGVFVTNYHVIDGATSLKVEVADGEVFENVFVVGANERRDLVLLRIPTTNTHFLRISDDRDANIAEPVFTMGNPLGLRSTFSDGIISGWHIDDGVSYLQITAPISPGSSGGAVLDRFGNVLAIATSMLEGGQNLNFAIPARHAAGLMGVATEIESFSDFATQSGWSGSSDSNNRSEMTNNILASLPEETQEEFSEYEPFQRQMMVRLMAYTMVANENSMELTDHVFEGVLEINEVSNNSVTLNPGSYVVLGVCDDDCLDLDLAVLDDSGDVIERDVDESADPVVGFDLDQRQRIGVSAKMIGCETVNCGFMLAIYR